MGSWLSPQMWKLRYRGQTLGRECPRILVSVAGPGTDPLWVLRDDCTLKVKISVHQRKLYKVKRQATNRKRYMQGYSQQGLLPKTCKVLLQISYRKIVFAHLSLTG